ncbi:NADH-quinone oxidoreductase subunit NuoH [Thermaurantiacus sp.]
MTGPVTLSDVLLLGLLSLGLTFVLLVAAGLFTFVERRLLGLMQERLGPNRVGPGGALQWVADTIKLLAKADEAPPGADRPLFALAPLVASAPLLVGFGLVFVGPGLGVARLDSGLLLALALLALTVWGVLMGGWASASRYTILGALRAAAQLLSLEAVLALAALGPVMAAASFSLVKIVEAQSSLWFLVAQPVAAALFLLAGIAAAHRLPFDLQESETELVAGYMTEYSGMRFALFFLGEYVAMLLVAALFVTLFLGGWHGPLLPAPLWFLIKLAAIAFLFIWIRAALPRPRFDQLVAAGWKVALPLALLNLLVTGAILVVMDVP